MFDDFHFVLELHLVGRGVNPEHFIGIAWKEVNILVWSLAIDVIMGHRRLSSLGIQGEKQKS